MKMNIKILFVLICASLMIMSPVSVSGQDRFDEMEQSLMVLESDIAGLSESIDISVNNVSIQEFFRAVSNNTSLNLTVDPDLNQKVTVNFSKVKVTDLLVFMCRKYDLQIDVLGNILSIGKYVAPYNGKPKSDQKKLVIVYDANLDKLTVDLRNDSLYLVVKEIVKQSKKNLVLAPVLYNQVITGYLLEMPFENALEKIAYSNGLVVQKTSDGSYLLDKELKQESKQGNEGGYVKTNKTLSGGGKLSVKYSENGLIEIDAKEVSYEELVSTLVEKSGGQVFFVSPLEGQTSITLKNASVERVLNHVFKGTEYTYKRDRELFLFGDKKIQELKSFRVIQLQHRTVDQIGELIPSDLKRDVEVKEFAEQNSILIGGPFQAIVEIEAFLLEIDKVVPVILIEVMIIDHSRSHTVTTGISAGLGTAPVTSGGSVLPGIDMTLGSQSINNIISSFNGFGWLNLGNVTPNFYVSIKALEDEGILKIRSTPRLSTLNGHEATMTIGKTEYYLEESNNVIGSQTPQNIFTRKYQSVNADMTITIKPIVSGDDQITLDIKVKQSDFTTRISNDAPPGQVSREFNSLIRIKNQEMVLLGGLEDRVISSTGKGLPWISRVPVLKWLTGNRSKGNKKSQLSIFIKPTIIY